MAWFIQIVSFCWVFTEKKEIGSLARIFQNIWWQPAFLRLAQKHYRRLVSRIVDAERSIIKSNSELLYLAIKPRNSIVKTRAGGIFFPWSLAVSVHTRFVTTPHHFDKEGEDIFKVALWDNLKFERTEQKARSILSERLVLFLKIWSEFSRKIVLYALDLCGIALEAKGFSNSLYRWDRIISSQL